MLLRGIYLQELRVFGLRETAHTRQSIGQLGQSQREVGFHGLAPAGVCVFRRVVPGLDTGQGLVAGAAGEDAALRAQLVFALEEKILRSEMQDAGRKRVLLEDPCARKDGEGGVRRCLVFQLLTGALWGHPGVFPQCETADLKL